MNVFPELGDVALGQDIVEGIAKIRDKSCVKALPKMLALEVRVDPWKRAGHSETPQ
jgi:hypothetical protein